MILGYFWISLIIGFLIRFFMDISTFLAPFIAPPPTQICIQWKHKDVKIQCQKKGRKDIHRKSVFLNALDFFESGLILDIIENGQQKTTAGCRIMMLLVMMTMLMIMMMKMIVIVAMSALC